MKGIIRRLGLNSILLVYGVIFLYFGVVGVLDSLKTPLDIRKVSSSQIKKGDIIEGDIIFNLGNYGYCTLGRTKYIKEQFFAIGLKDKKIIGYHVKNKKLYSDLLKQSEETFDFLKGSEEPPSQKIHIKGKVVKIYKDEPQAFIDHIDKIGLEKLADYGYSEYGHVEEYVIKEYNATKQFIFLGVGIVLLGLWIVIERNIKSAENK